MTGWSRELGWLLDLCRHDLHPGEHPAYDERLDAEAAAGLAAAHRVSTIAERSWTSLAERSLAPPPPAILRAQALAGRRRAFMAALHLVRLGRELEAEGVAWLSLKGPALSLQQHGDVTVRTARDLDVIVPEPQVGSAVAAAARAGWTAPARWREVMRITDRYHVEMTATLAGQPLLEMHTALAPRFVQFALDPFAGTSRGSVRIGAAEIPTLVGPAQTAYVAWHGARGLWFRLCWLLDYARLRPRGPDEAERVLATARACGGELAVRASAELAQRLLAVEPPPWSPPSRSMRRRVETVAGWGLERLRLGVACPRAWSPPGSYRWLWREVAQQEDVWRAAFGALGQITRPTADDALTLGPGLPLVLHRAARPYFGIRRLLGSPAGRLRDDRTG